ncbi:hypothetical protein Psfp_02330 [Pelotomaculum sp. FP]|uniref:hypothetical protein n=1 Tax=Pelotomaculum sp. FP TaxID=261474 RepID=UPI0010666FEF|nr:hypothetical protein [Pelotomaculum sp. FP]TEB15154.1 hypothetical protein Psfp_02330 [Pelotomaculum sp. FP]
MDITKIFALSNKELNILIALKVYKWIPVQGNWWMNPSEQFNCSPEKADAWMHETTDIGVSYKGKKYTGWPDINFNPSTNIDDAYKLEEHIKNLGLQNSYIKALCNIVIDETWGLIHATPKQRCQAALFAVMS